MKIAHLTTVDLSLRYLIFPQLQAAESVGEAYAISAPGPYVEEIEAAGVIHLPLTASTRGMDLVSDIRAMAQFWRVVRRLRPDILHTHNPKPGVYGRILGRLAGVPIVVNTVHGLYAAPDSSLLKKTVVYGLEAVAARFSDLELVQSPEDVELLSRYRITPESKLRLLGNGVDLRRFQPESAVLAGRAVRAEFGIPEDELVIGFVGRLVAEKGMAELIEMAERLRVRARVLVAGPPDPEKGDAVGVELQQRAREAGIEFIGMRTDIEAFYGALDVFVLPSYREGFPRAAMEAAASGLPVVASDIRGCRQVVDHGVNGFLVPVRDGKALADAVIELLDDHELRSRMGAASAEKARAEFDEDKVVNIVMTSYRQLASTKGVIWLTDDTTDIEVRQAESGDASAVARLHRDSIESGFLSSLGLGFLTLLYRAMIESATVHVHVAVADGSVVGFIAGAEDTSRFYKEFLRRHFLGALIRLLPALVRPRTWKKVLETLRYGSEQNTRCAELLSMAVAAQGRGRGVGKTLVEALLGSASAAGIASMRVVVGSDNEAAISLYRSAGFDQIETIEVHRGEASLEMTWQSVAS